MRRRTIIALVLTILCAVALNRYWLVFRPFQVGFDIKGQGIVNILVLLNKEDNTRFKHVKKAENTINLSESQEFEVIMNHVTSPKRLKLSLRADFNPMGGGGAGSLYISGIKLRGGKYRLNDLENFSAENADLKIQGDSLVVTPHEKEFSIYYNKPLKARSAVQFDFKVFVIILVLSFLLFYKLSDYLADFKTLKNQSRNDILFLVLIFVVLFIPMLKLDKEVYSVKELRPFAQYQPFIKDGAINFNWGNNYTNYFSDHFFLRDAIVSTYCKFRYYLAYKFYVVPGHAVFNKENHWGFRIEPYSRAIYKKLEEQTVKRISDNFVKLNQFCSKNNIKLYIVVVPSKEDIYKKHAPYFPAYGQENFHQIYDYIKSKTDVNLIFPSQQFKNRAEKDYLFFKTDHHWTDTGAFIGYKLLSAAIQKDFPDFVPLKEDDFKIFKEKQVRSDFMRDFHNGTTLSAFLNLQGSRFAKKILDVEYLYYEYKQNHLLETKIDYENMTKDFYFPSKNNLTAVEIGNSMSENFNDFLPFSFRHLKYFRANNGRRQAINDLKMADYQPLILELKPDVLILTITSAYIIPMLNMYESEN